MGALTASRGPRARPSAVLAVCVLAAGAISCTVKDTSAPPLTGPSELALRVGLQAVPDSILQDGSSQAMIQIDATGADSRPVRSLALRVGRRLRGDRPGFRDPIRQDRADRQRRPRAGDLYGATPSESARRAVQHRNHQRHAGRHGLPRRDGAHRGPPPDRAGGDPAAEQPAGRAVHLHAGGAPSDDQRRLRCIGLDRRRCAVRLRLHLRLGVRRRLDGDRRVRDPPVPQPGDVPGPPDGDRCAGRHRHGGAADHGGAGRRPDGIVHLLAGEPGLGQTVFFTAEASRAAAGRQIVSYQWNFGSGRTGSGVTITK